MAHRHIPEEQMIDFILGKLPSKSHFKVNAHLAICPKCSLQHDYWENHLKDEAVYIPSYRLKQRLFMDVQKKRLKRNNKMPYIALGFSIAIILFLAIFQLPKTMPTTSHDEINEDLTVQYEELINLLDDSTDHQFIDSSISMQITTSNQIHITNLSHEQLIYTYSFIDDTQFQWPYEKISSKENIVFMNKQAICIYYPDQAKLICIPADLESQSEQLMPVHLNNRIQQFQ